MTIPVSVIIPAYNAANTLRQTIASVQAQTVSDWEAIIVNDGSQDTTAEVAAQLAQEDCRIRTITQHNQGVSTARNTGIELAQHDWLLFLDADDTIAPTYLEKMIAPLHAFPELDGVLCRGQKIVADGQLLQESNHDAVGDLFLDLTRHCTLPNLNVGIFQKFLVKTVGRFEPSLKTCEDWDLWQRLARAGANFGVVDEVLAYYQVQPHSLSSKARQFLQDALRVIERGHRPDPRVPNPHPDYVNGAPIEEEATAKLYVLVWAAGLVIGGGDDPEVLFDLLAQADSPELDATKVAYSLFYTVTTPTSQPLTAWTHLWPALAPKILKFLHDLERRTQSPGLAKRSQHILENLIRQQWQGHVPAQIGTLYFTQIEVTAPLPELQFAGGPERLYTELTLEGSPLGTMELSISGRTMSQDILADAIVSDCYAWLILGRFFVHTVYSYYTDDPEQAHERDGWVLFLRELWGIPDAPSEQFYDPFYETPLGKFEPSPQRVTMSQTTPAPVSVEVSFPLPSFILENPDDRVLEPTSQAGSSEEHELEIVPTVAGIALMSVRVPAHAGTVTAQAIRAAVTETYGLELFRVAVREGLLGRSLQTSFSLRSRLAERAKSKLHIHHRYPSVA